AALEDARELLAAEQDPAMRDYLRVEVDEQEAKTGELEERLRELLGPSDRNAGKNVIVEIRGAEGGEEANLWAADLLHMYEGFAKRHGWKTEVLTTQPPEMGGFPRGRAAPGAARPRHREPGPGAHERGDGRGAARGRGGRRRRRPERPPDRRV